MEYQTRVKLIRILSDAVFHSGEQLGNELGISRAAVSKHIKVLTTWGLDIYRVQGKGYRLSHPLDMLDEKKLRPLLPECPRLELFPVIDSTNQYLMNQLSELEKGEVCIAEYQSAGRGRRGRQWFSPFGANLYFSMYWRLDEGISAAMGLSLVVGIAVVEALTESGCAGIKVKWPNDIYFQDKKLAGILVELSGQAGEAADLVIGMGMNIAMPEIEPTQEITQPWANLKDTCTHLPEKNQLTAHLINKVTQALELYEEDGFSPFVKLWAEIDNFNGREVKLIMPNKEIYGIARGINGQGALLLDVDGKITPYIGGEISLRGI